MKQNRLAYWLVIFLNMPYIGDNFETDIVSSSKAGMKAIWLNRDNAKSGCSEVNMIYDLKTLKF